MVERQDLDWNGQPTDAVKSTYFKSLSLYEANPDAILGRLIMLERKHSQLFLNAVDAYGNHLKQNYNFS